MAFEALGVQEELIKAISEMGWSLPKDVQAEAIPLILGGGDVMVSAATGSGKTGAFSLPVVQIVHEVLRKKQQLLNTSHFGLNESDCDDGITISDNHMSCSSQGDKWLGVRAAVHTETSRGQYYFRVKVIGGGVRIGWGSLNCSLNLGTCGEGYGFGFTGMKSNGGKFSEFGDRFSAGDIIGAHLDCEKRIIVFTKNGTNLGVAFNGINTRVQLFPVICLKGGSVEIINDKEINEIFRIRYSPIFTLKQTPIIDTDRSPKPIALILEPTKDLINQVHESLTKFTSYLNDPKIRIQSLITESNVTACDILISTPQRLGYLVSSHTFNTNFVKFFIIDEADQIASDDQVFKIKQIYQSLNRTCSGVSRLQVCMFSATLNTPGVKTLADYICQFPTLIDLNSDNVIPDGVYHAVYSVNPEQYNVDSKLLDKISTDNIHRYDKREFQQIPNENIHSFHLKIMKFLALMDIIKSLKIDRAVIFCRTNVDCDNLAANMRNYLSIFPQYPKFGCGVLGGFKSMDERIRALDDFKKNQFNYLICTDAVARGIDIDDLPYVINYTLPDSADQYIHRIGRTGRQGKTGVAISLVSTVPEYVWYHSNCGGKNKSNNCFNNKLVSQGGCAIWYDEPDLLNQIQLRMNILIPRITHDYKLPSDYEPGKPIVVRNRLLDGVVLHVESFSDETKLLQSMEIGIQNSYWSLKKTKLIR